MKSRTCRRGARWLHAAALVAGAAALAGCASAPPSRPPAVEVGLASWYGEPYHGRPTASGPRYDMEEMTAAHRTLPFGTLVRVTNQGNGKHADVLINDRGPFVAGRILDLSHAAAVALDAIEPGVVAVTVEVLRAGDGMPGARCWDVQVGAFAEAENVRRARVALGLFNFDVVTPPAGGGLTRVRITGLSSRKQAETLAAQLQEEFPGAMPVPCGGTT